MRDLTHYKGIPTKVRVGCFTYSVIIGSPEDHEVEGTYGHMSSFMQHISLRPRMSAHQLANTFIHEVLHAIHYVYGLIKHPDEPQPSEEEYTTLSANGLCAFWQDNPEAMRWWVKCLSAGA